MKVFEVSKETPRLQIRFRGTQRSPKTPRVAGLRFWFVAACLAKWRSFSALFSPSFLRTLFAQFCTHLFQRQRRYFPQSKTLKVQDSVH